MKNWRSFFSLGDFLYIAGFVSAFLIVVLCMQYLMATAELHLEVLSDKPGSLQIYWQTEEKIYSENKFQYAPVHSGGINHIIFCLPGVNRITQLRIDPLDTAGHITIYKVELKSSKIENIDLLPQILSEPVLQRHEMTLQKIGLHAEIESSGKDPYFEIRFPSTVKIDYGFLPLFLSGAVFILLFYFFLNRGLLKGHKYSGAIHILMPVSAEGNGFWNVPVEVKKTYSLGPVVQRAVRNGEIAFSVAFTYILPQDICAVVGAIRKDYPEAILYFQYNRASEV